VSERVRAEVVGGRLHLSVGVDVGSRLTHRLLHEPERLFWTVRGDERGEHGHEDQRDDDHRAGECELVAEERRHDPLADGVVVRDDRFAFVLGGNLADAELPAVLCVRRVVARDATVGA
jgi:hypothetical protein